MTKTLCFIFSVILAFSFISTLGHASSNFDVAAESAIVVEASTGRVLFEKNADAAMAPASITKLMTLLLCFEAIKTGIANWDDIVVISEDAWRMGGSQMFLEIGQEVTFEDLVTGISVVSANDACVAVAEHLYGSEAAFVRAMNSRAQELGMTNSHFVNSSGLTDENHKMSARDITILSGYLINNHPKILELEVQREFTFNDIPQYNRNPLLGVFPGADGLKTGWTNEAGHCLVGTAVQHGIRIISVVLNTESEHARFTASRELLNLGFRSIYFAEIAKRGDIIEEAPIKHGTLRSIPITVENPLSVLVPVGREDDIKLSVVREHTLTAPVTAGEYAGTLEAKLDGEILGSINLVAVDDVPKLNWFMRMLRSIGDFFKFIFTLGRK